MKNENIIYEQITCTCSERHIQNKPKPFLHIWRNNSKDIFISFSIYSVFTKKTMVHINKNVAS